MNRPCLDRLLRFYEPVTKYLIDCPEAEKRGKATSIRDTLVDPKTRPVLMFLSAVLKNVDFYNVTFQVKAFKHILQYAYCNMLLSKDSFLKLTNQGFKLH